MNQIYLIEINILLLKNKQTKFNSFLTLYIFLNFTYEKK